MNAVQMYAEGKRFRQNYDQTFIISQLCEVFEIVITVVIVFIKNKHRRVSHI